MSQSRTNTYYEIESINEEQKYNDISTSTINSTPQLYPATNEISKGTIHQIWMQGMNHLKENRPQFYDCMLEFIEMNNGKHQLWSEDMLISLIKNEYPHLEQTYNNYPHFIMRVDLAKYIILHKYGGFYVDMDSKCKQSFDSLQRRSEYNKNNQIMVCRVVDDRRTKLYAKKFINNHFFYVPTPKHPFMTLMLQQIPLRAKRRKVETMILYILRAVGPGFLMHCIKKYKKIQQKKLTKSNMNTMWYIPCTGNKLHTEDVVNVIKSNQLNIYFIHLSKNTWLEKSWLDDKDKSDAFKITTTVLLIGGAALVGMAVIIII